VGSPTRGDVREPAARSREPIAALASGRVWRREDVEAFGRDRVRRKGRRIAR
jgi:hypothetical protein